MASLGMIGAIGGVGAGFSAQAQFLGDEEKANNAATRQQKLEEWRMSTKEQYDIRSEERGDVREVAREGRQDTREVARETRGEERAVRTEGRTDKRAEEQKDRDFTRLQGEAPARRDLKAEDTKSDHRTRSALAAETVDVDAGVKGKLTEAGQTDSGRRLQEAQATEAESRAEALGREVKETPQVKVIREQADKIEADIRKATLGQTFDPKNIPAHAQLKKQLEDLRGLQMSARQDAEKRRGAAANAAAKDGPQDAELDALRAKREGKTPGKPGSSPTASKPGDTDMTMIYQQEQRKAREQLAAATTDVERTRAQNDLAAIARDAKRAGVTLDAEPAGSMVKTAAGAPMTGPFDAAKVTPPIAPGAAPAKPQTPATAGGSTAQEALANFIGGKDSQAGLNGKTPAGAAQEADATSAELSELEGKTPSLKDGMAAREQFGATVEKLRAKLGGIRGRAEYQQYQRERGERKTKATGVAFGPARQ